MTHSTPNGSLDHRPSIAGSATTLPLHNGGAEWFMAAMSEARAVSQQQHIPYGLTLEDFRAAYRTVAMANCAGLIMDYRIDVSWLTVGITGEENVARAQQALFMHFWDWLIVRQLHMSIIAVFEIGRRFGLHSHIMMTLSPELIAEFEPYCRNVLTTIVGRSLVDTHDIKTMLMRAGNNSLEAQWARFRYLMKGVSPFATLPARAGDQGLVPLHSFADLKISQQGLIQSKRLLAYSALPKTPTFQDHLPALPDMDIRIDGPQLYGERYLNWHRAATGQPHFQGEFPPRNATHLIVPMPG